MKRIKNEIIEFKLLLKEVPTILIIGFIAAIIVMNILANKSINLGVSWLALDCGIIVSWVTFLIMDVVVKHFGPKAATEISILAIVCSLVISLIFYLASLIPGTWGESYVSGSEDIINGAFTVYTVADILWDSGNTSGIMYLQYTKSPIAAHIGKYYAIAFKDLTDISVSFCTASDPNTPYRDTLDEAKKDYSKENASTYFAEYRYHNYNMQAN